MRNLLRATTLAVPLLCAFAGPAAAAAANADIKITVTNGNDTAGTVRIQVRPAGQHNADVIAEGGSGDDVMVPAGTYDVDVNYNDGAANKIIWFDKLAISGKVEKKVDMGLPVAELHVLITNGGKDIGGDGEFEVRPAGNRNGDVIAYASSGGSVRLAAGTYTMDARYQDGAVQKYIWLDNLALAGKVNKTVEVNAAVADVTWHITNQGKDVGDDGKYEMRPAGNHQGDVIAYASSGGTVRLPAGAYNIDFHYIKGMINKIVWLDNQTLKDKVNRTTDLMLNLAMPTVSATLNGEDVGNKARIGILPAGNEDEIGDMQGGETATLETGRYDLAATVPGAEGTLKNVMIQGQPHLVIAMKPLVTAELKVGGPLPKECTIEVYGVNFDFDKAALRPDSEPVLKAVLQLFTAAPTFSAEVGGHTDNVGKPDYNMKLSEARAAAVKDWLVAKGVVATRLTSRGYGDTHPLMPNDNDADRFKNRRVELRRVNCQ